MDFFFLTRNIQLRVGIARGLFAAVLFSGSVSAGEEAPPPEAPKAGFHTAEEQGFAQTFEAALAFDPQLKRAYWNYQSEIQEADLAASQLLPDIRLSSSYQYEDSDNIYTDEGSSSYDPDLARSSGQLVDSMWRVSLRQPLFNYSAYQNYQRGLAVAEASEYRYQRSEQELIYRVSERFIGVLLAAQQVYLNQQKLDALELKKAQAERAKQLGVGDQLRVLYVGSNRDLANTDLLQAKSALTDAKTLLANLTGYDVKFPERWIGSTRTITPKLLSGAKEEWLDSVNENYSVKEAQARIIQEQANLDASKGEHLPVLSLSLSYLDRDSEDDLRTRKDAVAALELSMPLYSGGQTQAKVRKARARVNASEAERDYVITEKIQQIKLSYDRLNSLRERLVALAESRESGKGYLDAAERQVALNLSDQVNVLDARTQLVDTELQIAQTMRDYLLSDLILRLEAGKLTKQRLVEYDQLFNAVTVPKAK
ncbi:MAG: TolC family protein [Hahellaceae bacterium]|nr:TolC family protein [Hahellaceae bacterium]MCP5211300.1 TolC family protein [Hahellaceae bacterium]